MGGRKKVRGGALAAEEAVEAVCRHFQVGFEELAMTGRAPREDVRAARAACGLLAAPAGLAILAMGRRIGYASKSLLALRRRYWSFYRYDRRGFRLRFRALCRELGLPAEDESLQQALGFKAEGIRNQESGIRKMGRSAMAPARLGRAFNRFAVCLPRENPIKVELCWEVSSRSSRPEWLRPDEG